MRRFCSLAAVLLAALTASPEMAAAAGKSMLVCAAPDGSFTVKRRCRKGEARVQVQTLFPQVVAGPTGPAGAAGEAGAAGGQGAAGDTGPRGSLGFESCRKASAVSTNMFNGSGTTSAAALCNQASEFMLTYGFNANAPYPFPNFIPDPNLRVVVQSALAYTSGFPYGVEVTAERIATASSYVLIVNAVCCPR